MEVISIVLAAGLGTRMKSDTPKVLHELMGKPIISHIINTLNGLGVSETRVVVGKEVLDSKIAVDIFASVKIVEQKDRLGTAHALSVALKESHDLPVMVLGGDSPLVRKSTLRKLYDTYKQNNATIAVLGFKTKRPKGYGRLIAFEDDLVKVVEEKDATAEQRKINLCNAGIYIIDQKVAPDLLQEIENKNKSQEYYLPDIIEVANKKGLKCVFSLARESEVIGINNRIELAKAEAVLQRRLRKKLQLEGVTFIDPKTVYLSSDTQIGKDSVIYPNVYLGSEVKIGANCKILSFSHIEGLTTGQGCRIGPFARIRKHTVFGDNCHIGNFVEAKAAKLGNNVKASHLSYLGDGEIGSNTNIGAGTIFCNYDGYAKHHTTIGSDVFIGSNVALIAPINIGDGAIIGAGSVITENVEDDSLSIARARQVNFKQKADLIRRKKSKREQ